VACFYENNSRRSQKYSDEIFVEMSKIFSTDKIDLFNPARTPRPYRRGGSLRRIIAGVSLYYIERLKIG